MKDKLLIKARLDDIQQEIIPQNDEIAYIHSQIIDTLCWVYNNGELRTEEELNLKIQTTKEELIGFEFMNDSISSEYKATIAKLKELEFCLM